MDWIKNLRFSIFLALAGLGLLVLGLTGGISVGKYVLVMTSAIARTSGSIVGLILIGLSIWLEYFRNPTHVHPEAAESKKVRAQDVLHTLDDNSATTFPTRVKDAHRISIFARTAVNLLNTYQETFLEVGRRGASVRLLFVNPHSDASRTIYGGSHQIFVQNARTTQHVLSRLKAQMGARLDVRATQHAPTFGITMIEHAESLRDLIDVQFYFLHALTGRNRPILSIHHDDKWYNAFRDEFETLWNEAAPWDLSATLDEKK
jgi:hypothetical protein